MFCQALHMTPFHIISDADDVALLKPILPFGTDGLINSGYYPFNITDDLTVRPDQQCSYFLKD